MLALSNANANAHDPPSRLVSNPLSILRESVHTISSPATLSAIVDLEREILPLADAPPASPFLTRAAQYSAHHKACVCVALNDSSA